MTKNTWMSAPTGAPGQGGADVRPLGGIAVGAAVPPLAVLQGSGLPAARFRSLGVDLVPTGTAPTGTAPTGTVLAGLPVVENLCTPRGGFTAQYDGTTLGSHPSSRPLS
jgi:hypothetical protein